MDLLRLLIFINFLPLRVGTADAELLRLTVADARGDIIPNAQVRIGGQPPLSPSTDGVVEAQATAPVVVRISAPGFAPETR